MTAPGLRAAARFCPQAQAPHQPARAGVGGHRPSCACHTRRMLPSAAAVLPVLSKILRRGVRLVLPALLACAAAPSGADAVAVKVLAINDFHGSLQTPPGELHLAEPAMDAGAPTRTRAVRAGGAAQLATLLARLKAQNAQHIVVAAGDLVGASPLLSALFHDEPTIEALSRMGLELSAVGNHEFDRGAAELLRLQHGGCAAEGCRGPRPFAGAGFQYLAASTVDRGSGRTILPAYRIKRFAGVPVAFIGLTLRGTPGMVSRSGIRGLRFLDEARSVNALVPELRRQGVEAIVLLIHQGGVPAQDTLGGTDACAGFSGPIVGIVQRLDRAVDLVVSGHTHRAYTCRVDGRLVTSASSHGRMVTEIDLQLDRRSGKIIDATARNHVVDADLPADAEQRALIDAYERLARPLAQRVVAPLAAPVSRKTDAAGESLLGRLIADAQLEATRAAGAELALMNPGGIRAALVPGADGLLRYEQLFAAQPFGNQLVTMSLSGRQLVELLEQQWRGQPLAAGRVLQVSAGFAYTWDAARPPGQRIVADSLRLHGRRIGAQTNVRVTVNSFMAEGGDRFSVLRQGRERRLGVSDLQALEAHLKTRPAPPLQARITRLH